MGTAPCAPIAITPGVVTFDPEAFKTAYPAFAGIDDAVLTANFALAVLMLNNSCCSVVKDAPTRAMLLNLVTAHITQLLNGANGDPAPGVVGRISSATEGSVSVSTEMLAKSESASYWQQTQWGATFWTATTQYRMARYVPPCDTGFGANPWDAWPQ